jgi:hypothetical protein
VRFPSRSALAVAFLLVSNTAQADIVTYNATSFPLGVDVSHALDGVTLQRLSWGDGGPRVYSPDVTPVITSVPWYTDDPVSFGPGSGLLDYESCYRAQAGFGCSSFVSVLELTFDAPTNFLRLVSATASGNARVLAYTSAGTQIDVCANGGCLIENVVMQGFIQTTITVTRGQADISRAVWGGLTNVVFGQEISYNVPEPSTGLLVGLGVSWLTLSGRRRRKITRLADNPKPTARTVGRPFTSQTPLIASSAFPHVLL